MKYNFNKIWNNYTINLNKLQYLTSDLISSDINKFWSLLDSYFY